MTTPQRRVITALACTTAMVVAAALTPAPAAVAENAGARSLVFTRGEGGYHTFRIPALVEGTDGTLLAIAEGKADGPGDWGNMDVVVKRSTDGGASWGPIQVIAGSDTGDKWSNAVPVVDERTGRIVLSTNRIDGTAEGADVECGRTPVTTYIQHSDDQGATWSDPVDISGSLNPGNWRMIAAGPGHGIQLTQGEHAGRLLIPGRHSYVDAGQECASSTGAGGHVRYSDDGGTTWQIGAVDQQRNPALRPNEVSAVELSDGRVYFSARDQGDTPGHRVDTTSSDGGETFDEPYDAVNGVISSTIEGSLIRLPARSGARDRVILSLPNHPTSREKLTLWSSFDSGRTWATTYEVYDGPSAYSDLVLLDEDRANRSIGVLFEGGKRFYPGDQQLTYHHDIYFVRVPERRLDLPTPPPTVTPDTVGDHDGFVSGKPRPVAGRFGSALKLTGDYVELPHHEELAFGNQPFTAAAWFRTSYLGNNQALFYAHNRFGPRWSIQVEPSNGNVITAQMSTDRGATRSLTAPGDFVDNAWHHVALVREADRVALYVDGVLATTAASIGEGSVSAGVRTGIRLGARVDGINAQFIGSIDEAWLFDTALTAEQVAELVARNRVTGATPVTRLPLDRLVAGQ